MPSVRHHGHYMRRKNQTCPGNIVITGPLAVNANVVQRGPLCAIQMTVMLHALFE